MLWRLLILLVTLAALVLPASALAGGGDYGFEGATPAERSTVRAALNASAFDWIRTDDSASMRPAEFRTLLSSLVGMPATLGLSR